MTPTHKITLTGLALVTAVAMLVIVAASSWAERPPETGTGTGVITTVETIDGPRDTGPNRVETRRLTGTLDGALQGTFFEEVRGVVSADGEVRFQGTAVFDGALDGCGSGTVDLRVNGRGQAGQAPGLPATVADVRIVDQASNTLAVTGHGTITQEGADLTYDIAFHCLE